MSVLLIDGDYYSVLITSIGRWGSCTLIDHGVNSTKIKEKRTRFHRSLFITIAMCACKSSSKSQRKKVRMNVEEEGDDDSWCGEGLENFNFLL